jgi:hypothetical protein
MVAALEIERVGVSAQTRNLPVPEMAVPFPVLVPVPEVQNPISGTELTIHFLRFLAQAPVQSRAVATLCP